MPVCGQFLFSFGRFYFQCALLPECYLRASVQNTFSIWFSLSRYFSNVSVPLSARYLNQYGLPNWWYVETKGGLSSISVVSVFVILALCSGDSSTLVSVVFFYKPAYNKFTVVSFFTYSKSLTDRSCEQIKWTIYSINTR